ncbi:MAG: DUF4255 domain-containing protein [Bacteroidetes bacterium]|nr:DUF4255 domain-containing protein [Bacteroidota bacterium]
MIHTVLSAVTDQMNEFMRNELGIPEDIVVMNNLVDLKGDVSLQIENRVCLFLLRVEEEKMTKAGGFQANPGSPPPMRINLYLVFAAHFPDPNYREALHFISLVIEFFQGKSTFDKSNTPGLSANIDKLIFEFVNQDLSEMNNMWSLIGAKYIPSVVYKVRMLTFSQFMIREEVPSIVRPAARPRTPSDIFNASGALNALKGILAGGATDRAADLLRGNSPTEGKSKT